MGEQSTWAAWADSGGLWFDALGAIDRAIETFAVRAELGEDTRIEKSRWDAPDRLIIFPNATAVGAWNNLHLLIEDTSLRVSAAAWLDLEKKDALYRWWCHSTDEVQRRWRVRLWPLEGLERRTVDALLSAHLVVAGWRAVVDHAVTWQGDGLTGEAPSIIPQVSTPA